MENNKIRGVANDREILRAEILACMDKMDMERLKMLYITAKIWEGRFNGTATE